MTNLERVIAKNPTSSLFARLADACLRQGDVNRAIETCRQGLRYRPSYVSGHVVLGKSHFAAGMFEEARRAFNKVLHLDPHHTVAIWYLGQIDRTMGWDDLALRNFQKARDLDPLSQSLQSAIDDILTSISSQMGQKLLNEVGEGDDSADPVEPNVRARFITPLFTPPQDRPEAGIHDEAQSPEPLPPASAVDRPAPEKTAISRLLEEIQTGIPPVAEPEERRLGEEQKKSRVTSHESKEMVTSHESRVTSHEPKDFGPATRDPRPATGVFGPATRDSQIGTMSGETPAGMPVKEGMSARATTEKTEEETPGDAVQAGEEKASKDRVPLLPDDLSAPPQPAGDEPGEAPPPTLTNRRSGGRRSGDRLSRRNGPVGGGSGRSAEDGASGGGSGWEDIPITTATLAEIYAGQGLITQAIAIFEKVLEREPDNARARERLSVLRAQHLANAPQ